MANAVPLAADGDCLPSGDTHTAGGDITGWHSSGDLGVMKVNTAGGLARWVRMGRQRVRELHRPAADG